MTLPDRGSERLPRRDPTLAWVADVVLFSPEMVVGIKADRNRELMPARPGWQVSQTSHDQAAISADMTDGWMPERNREQLPLRTGRNVWISDLAILSPEMMTGSRPDSPRLLLGARIPQPISQPTHAEAPFGGEMVAGWQPARNRERLPLRVGLSILAPEVLPFSVEMIVGSRPDSPRILLGSRIPLPVSQPTHVSAPFSADMAAGSVPDRNRERLPLRIGQQIWISDLVTLSPEMMAGSRPDMPPRLFRAPLGSIAQVADIVPFSVEMIVGSKPDTPRLFLAPRIPLPPSQPTHVSAPISQEMIAGSNLQELRGRQTPPAIRAWLLMMSPDVSFVELNLIRMHDGSLLATTLSGEAFLVTSHTSEDLKDSN